MSVGNQAGTAEAPAAQQAAPAETPPTQEQVAAAFDAAVDARVEMKFDARIKDLGLDKFREAFDALKAVVEGHDKELSAVFAEITPK